MTTEQLIAASDFCMYHNIEYTFISSLQEAGLVNITVVNQITFIPKTELQKLEKMVRLHNELDINIAGIEAITHLLQRVEQMQEDMRGLRNRLKMYETK